MARVTVEDCVERVPNRFSLVLLAAHRARGIATGAELLVDRDNRPVWNPSTADGVTGHMIDTIFAPLPDDQMWTPLGR